MKSCVLILFLFSATAAATAEETTWWQRERLTPTQNQIVNPTYIQIRSKLEQLWDQRNKAIAAQRNFASKGQNTNAIIKAVAGINRQIAEKEETLKSLSPYIDKAQNSPVQSPQKTAITNRKTHNPHIVAQEDRRPGNLVKFKLDLQYMELRDGRPPEGGTFKVTRRTLQLLLTGDGRYQNTGGIRYYGIIVMPSDFIRSVFKDRESSRRIMGVNAPFCARPDFPYFPKSGWSEKTEAKELKIMSEKLKQGHAVFLPLTHDGDSVYFNMPDGLYFLTSVTVFKSGNRYHSGWLRSPRIPKLNDGESNGKYIDIIKVNARKTLSPVIYQPIWGHGHDPRRNQVRFFNAFEREGAMHIINAYEKEQNNQRKLLEQARLNNSHKTSKTSAARARVIIKIRCPGCTSLNDENAKFCNQCGKRQITVPESTKPDK